MQIAVLVETMRRENYEMSVSRPKVILKKDENGTVLEPFETIFVEVPEENTSAILKLLSARRAQIESMETVGGRTHFGAQIPTRGIIGFEFQLVNITSGHGVFSHLFSKYAPFAGEISDNRMGRLVSMENGVASRYAILGLEERGRLFISPQDQVYAGEIVGENPRAVDIPVNPCREKHLTNIRSAGKDATIPLTPPVVFSLERAIEYIGADELVEATPHHIRMRKRILDINTRIRTEKKEGKLGI